MADQISRKYSFRGQRVMVELRDGGELTGTLIGWGTRVMQLQVDDSGWRELDASQIGHVYRAC